MKRRNFSRKVRFEIIKRATNERGRLICEGCGIDVTGLRVEIDHVLAEALVMDKSQALTAKDGQLLGLKCCHRGGDNKTKGDIQRIRKADRQRNSHAGLKAAGRGFRRPDNAEFDWSLGRYVMKESP